MIFRSKLVERALPAVLVAGSQIPFAQDPDLIDSYLLAIEAFDNNTLTQAPSGNPVPGTIEGVAITISDMKQNQKIQQYPLNDLNPVVTNGMIRNFFPIDLDWQQSSFVTILDPANLNAGESLVFNVIYCRKEEFEEYRRLYRFYAGA